MTRLEEKAPAAKAKAKAKAPAAKTKAKTKAKASAWGGSHPIMPTAPENEPLLRKLRAMALRMPGTDEAINHGRPCFRVREKTFVMFLDNHHHDGRVAIWCKAPPGAQAMIVEGDPVRYFVPPYVGTRGWIGARLDRKPDWAAIEALVTESYSMTSGPARKVAPKPRAR